MNSNTPSLAMTINRTFFVTFNTSCSGSAKTPTVSATESPRLLENNLGIVTSGLGAGLGRIFLLEVPRNSTWCLRLDEEPSGEWTEHYREQWRCESAEARGHRPGMQKQMLGYHMVRTLGLLLSSFPHLATREPFQPNVCYLPSQTLFVFSTGSWFGATDATGRC